MSVEVQLNSNTYLPGEVLHGKINFINTEKDKNEIFDATVQVLGICIFDSNWIKIPVELQKISGNMHRNQFINRRQ